MKNLKRWLVALLSLQIIAYVSGVLITYLALTKSDTEVLAALLPLTLFRMLFWVNLVLFIIYATKASKNKEQKFSKTVLVLAIVVGVCLLSYGFVGEWLQEISLR